MRHELKRHPSAYPKQRDIPASPQLEIKHSYNLKILRERVREAMEQQKELLNTKAKDNAKTES